MRASAIDMQPVIYDVPHTVRTFLASLVAVALLPLFLTHAFSQAPPYPLERWEFRSFETNVGFDPPPLFSPRVAFDASGDPHFAWIARDPNSAGYQVFYAIGSAGEISSPILATDTGTVFDRFGPDSNTYVFEVDRQGYAHIAFLSNVQVPGQGLRIGLYYTNSSTLDFAGAVRLTSESGLYGLAVDSAGIAHVVWIEQRSGKIILHHWQSDRTGPGSDVIATLDCGTDAQPCRVGSPEVEIAKGRLNVFFRTDSGETWHASGDLRSLALTVRPLNVPVYDPPTVTAGKADLRLRSAIDTSGAYYLAIPHRDPGGLPKLLLGSGAGPLFSTALLTGLDSTLFDFSIATDADRLTASWGTFGPRFTRDRPKTGIAEYSIAAGTPVLLRSLPDLNVFPGVQSTNYRYGGATAIQGDRVIAAVLFAPTVTDRREYGFIERTTLRPSSAYMIPDAGAPGMSVVVETIAPQYAFGAFGIDSLQPTIVEMELVDPADSQRIVVGPSVVSWDGRMVSTMLFIRDSATPGDVPMRIRVGSERSNPQVFRVVEPQRLGQDGSGRLTGGGVLGSGGIYGRRSPRGVLVVDTLSLAEGEFTFDLSDTDPVMPGNQGLLPVVILARGPIVIDSTASLSASASKSPLVEFLGVAGPGGGGGGGGTQFGGGVGFTAGGVPGTVAKADAIDRMGSFGNRFGPIYSGGNPGGVPGGAAWEDSPGGGGTGHPFGSSGWFGQISMAQNLPLLRPAGGYGAGSAGSQGANGQTSSGGGGGFASAGGSGGPSEANNGLAVGSAPLVPLAGGSGGGGAWSSVGHAAGGGGGGAIAVYSYRDMQVHGQIRADGGDGSPNVTGGDGGGGGAGSGGGVIVGARGGLFFGNEGGVYARGGKGGRGALGWEGGNGAYGRVRFDGRVDHERILHDPLPAFLGPSTGMNGAFQIRDSVAISGYSAPGSKVRLYVKAAGRPWDYDRPIDVVADTGGIWKTTILAGRVAGASELYVAALQQFVAPSSESRMAAPKWVMSSAGGSFIGRPGMQLHNDVLEFGCVDYGSCDTLGLRITNTGIGSDLVILGAAITGNVGGWFALRGESPLRIPPGETKALQVVLCPPDTGTIAANLRIITNLTPDSTQDIALFGCGLAGRLVTDLDTVDLGELCRDACRDTTIVLINEGDAPLTVTDVTAKDLAIRIIEPALPITIEPKGRRTVRIRACRQAGGGDFAVAFKATTPISPRSLVLRAQSGDPVAEFIRLLEMRNVDIGRDERCRDSSIAITNRGPKPMTVDSVVVTGAGFEVVDPPRGAVIPSGGSLTVTMRFCADSIGLYSGEMRLALTSGGCSLDTAATLSARVINSEPDLRITRDRVDLQPTQVLLESNVVELSVVNRGEGIARNVRYRIEPIAPATAAEFRIAPPSPFDVPGGGSQMLTISARPADTGLRRANLIFETDFGWTRTVLITVVGTRPGIVADTFHLDFGVVRVGSNSERSLTLTNVGSQLDKVTEITFSDPSRFSVIDPQPTYPIPLIPGIDSRTLGIRFVPNVEGEANETLTIVTESGDELDVTLTGTGVLEHAGLNVDTIVIPCPGGATYIDLLDTLRVTNTGAWPLTVRDIRITNGSPRFGLPDTALPATIPPGGSLNYTIRYSGSMSREATTITVTTSAEETTTIVVIGEECIERKPSLSFFLPDTTATVNDTIYLPITVLAEGDIREPIPFVLLLRYERSVVMPGLPGPGDIVPRYEQSTFSVMKVREPRPGELRIEGTYAGGAPQTTVIAIPMRVLLGETYHTDLTLAVSGLPPSYRSSATNGSLHVLDCDTTGAIKLNGLYAIKQNTPNPVDEATVIPFSVARREHVRILLYDATGTVIRTLVDDVLDAGRHELVIDTGDLSAGFYYYEMLSGRFREVLRMIVVQ